MLVVFILCKGVLIQWVLFVILFIINMSVIVMEKDYYKVLKVSENDDETVIKKAYKEEVKKYHPDNNPSDEAKEKMQEASEAYSILGDSDKRKEYDLTRKSRLYGGKRN